MPKYQSEAWFVASNLLRILVEIWTFLDCRIIIVLNQPLDWKSLDVAFKDIYPERDHGPPSVARDKSDQPANRNRASAVLAL